METLPAIAGGPPQRKAMLPYGRQNVSENDIESVVTTLRSGWLTTGPQVEILETAFSNYCGQVDTVAVCNGTAALHCMLEGCGLHEGDEVIVPTLSFVATANAVLYAGAIPVFADIDSETLLIDPENVEARITPKTKAILAMDYAGQPCDYTRLRKLADTHRLILLADACHSMSGTFNGKPVGSLADASAFSLHPIKPITSGEGGLITTSNAEWAAKMRSMRNHGLTLTFRDRESRHEHFYGVEQLGWNYRLSDLQCALAHSQLKQLPTWHERRQQLAKHYFEAFERNAYFQCLSIRSEVSCAWHLFPILLHLEMLKVDRDQIFRALRMEGIGVNVHYFPIHLQTLYRNRFKTAEGLCPIAEASYPKLLTLPLFASMSDTDQQDVIQALFKVLNYYKR
jgi:perosamine synthetase